jgi:hypothetical protein
VVSDEFEVFKEDGFVLGELNAEQDVTGGDSGFTSI